MLNSKILCEEVSPDNSKARDAQLLVYWYLQSRHIKPRIMVPETMMESRFPALTCSISGPTWTSVNWKGREYPNLRNGFTIFTTIFLLFLIDSSLAVCWAFRRMSFQLCPICWCEAICRWIMKKLNWRFSHLPLFFNNVAVIMRWGRRYRHVLDALVVLVVIKVILNKLNLNSMKFILNFCIKGFNTCLLWSNSLKHRVNSKMSNFLLRVVLECFSSDLENGTHLKLNNHLYQAECQKQNLLHLPMLKLIPVPLGDRLYPPVLPEYQMSTTALGTGLQRLSSMRPRRITAFSLSTSSVSGASWCLEPT